MALAIEVKERQKHLLGILLNVKKANPGITVIGLQKQIEDAVIVMEPEDVALVEKIVGVKALEE
ncbi:MAG: hypothetical protein FWG83_00810 [Oscillospiraceae bacterium]|nr:hypothetical protein [Oscillospiraceae bacterium]